jgi:hypothetical protein
VTIFLPKTPASLLAGPQQRELDLGLRHGKVTYVTWARPSNRYRMAEYVLDHILSQPRLSSVLVSYEKIDGVAKVSMDDGKVNVMSVAMLRELTTTFARAEKDGVAVILTSSRRGIFSAGFDTKILGRKDPQEVFEMVRLGAELAARVLAFSRSIRRLRRRECEIR